MGSAFFTTNTWGTSGSKSRPGTSSGEQRDSQAQTQTQTQTQTQVQAQAQTQKQTNVLTKDRDRRPSFGRKASFSSPRARRRASFSASNGTAHIRTDASAPPAIPNFALAAAAKLSRDTEAVLTPAITPTDPLAKATSGRPAPAPATAMNGLHSAATSPPTIQTGQGSSAEASFAVHQHIHELANKRISTLDYLRKAHEGRIYWFNTLLFDKPDLARMPYFDNRKLARRATNYLLLGLSLPTVIDLNSSTPLEFLRSLNTLLTEFESYQQIHTENGTNTSTLSRARLPQMFRRGPGGKGRRQSGAGVGGDTGLSGTGYGEGGPDDGSNHYHIGSGGGGGGGTGGGQQQQQNQQHSVISFGLGAEGGDLLPGEEYTHLLTPNLPFDPDFFETFATLCDVLIDCYARLTTLLPSPRDCAAQPGVAELFAKADAKVRKLLIQGVVREFEDASRAGVRTEVTSVGKVVLGGLM
ncbi:hypothetical protein DL769_007193 [Monosporascus sp. CRB-8-3]|nr:hypothetical protein DL769_007193 [Monosporascus sp. CRB-8-3]